MQSIVEQGDGGQPIIFLPLSTPEDIWSQSLPTTITINHKNGGFTQKKDYLWEEKEC